MSMLVTYRHPNDDSIVAYHGVRRAVRMAPGEMVRHMYVEGSLGTLIANGDDFITVLWSVYASPREHSPGFVYAPYVPLQITPTFLEQDDVFQMPRDFASRYSSARMISGSFSTVLVKDISK